MRVNPGRIEGPEAALPRTGPVVYWMSRDQRVRDNWALHYARDLALAARAPLYVAFCLVPEYPGATWRHYDFMLRGLAEVEADCREMGLAFTLRTGHPPTELAALCRTVRAAAAVADFDPSRLKRAWRAELAQALDIPLFVVDAHNVVPCRAASGKKEFAARTLRPKIQRLLPEFLEPFSPLGAYPYRPAEPPAAVNWDHVRTLVAPDRSVGPVPDIVPGSRAGERVLAEFAARRLAGYAARRNDPNANAQSGLSPYFHFGQLAPQRAALTVWPKVRQGDPDAAAFFEECVIRRELADNFCLHEPAYDSFDGLPEWGRATLAEHARDARPYLYDLAAFEAAATHSPLWNAAQRQMLQTGKMHGYMRMYWAKKILEWSADPRLAVDIATRLNDRHGLDGRDPCGYVGVLWSVGGLHDRPYFRRPIFGQVRYMNAAGCGRKFDTRAYIARFGGRR